jgi:hypothetical protein
MFLCPFGLYCGACFGILFVVGPILSFEDFTSVLMSPGQVTGPSQDESSGGAATLMPLDLHAFL